MARLRFSFIIKSLVFAGALCAAGCASDVRPNEGADGGVSNDSMTADSTPAMDSAPVCTNVCRPGFIRNAQCVCVSQCMPECSAGQSCQLDGRTGTWDCMSDPVDAGTPDVVVPVDNGPPPTCNPGCRAGFACVGTTCVSNCNPTCNSGEECRLTGSNGWMCFAPPDAGTPDVVVPVDNGPPPTCNPGCRDPFVCVGTMCVSACNPGCASNERCEVTNGVARCISTIPDAGTPDVPTVVDAGAPDAPDAPLSCATGFADCNGNRADGCEINTSNSARNCGVCGNVCPNRSNSFAACISGRCDIACAQGFADCNGNMADGCEANIATTMTNCGACGNVCADRPNASATCSVGACRYACNPGYADCNGTMADGCEANVMSNNASCGACGRACPSGSVCANGSCSLTCNPGDGGLRLTACGTTCTDTQTDIRNCGSCGNVCPTVASTHPTCVAGRCVNACNNGRGDCDRLEVNFCEIELTSDVANCGGCGVRCTAGSNSDASCDRGYCDYTCRHGFGDCDWYGFNGCEANLNSDRNNCGGCGNRCGASQTCVDGVCTGALCPPGQVQCFGLCADRSSEIFNCGACGITCPVVANGNRACTSGLCNISSCNTGFSDCDRFYGNGCEVDTRIDTANCGACGRRCATGETCSAGVCTPPACPTGQTSCSGICRSTASDVSNCGSCGNVCPLRPNAFGSVCSSGSCDIMSCNAGFANCNMNVVDGCEINVMMSNTNCGMCGRVCTGSQTCVMGLCTTPPTPDAGVDAGPDVVDASADVPMTDVPSSDGSVSGAFVCPEGMRPRTVTYRLPSVIPIECGTSPPVLARPVFWGRSTTDRTRIGTASDVTVTSTGIPMFSVPFPTSGTATSLPLRLTNTAVWPAGVVFRMSARCNDRDNTYYEGFSYWERFATLAAAGGSLLVDGVEYANEVRYEPSTGVMAITLPLDPCIPN